MDTVLGLIRSTALNPSLLLPLILLARFTKKGETLSILHPTAYARLKALLALGTFRILNNWLSDKVLNNWQNDKYTWSREIVLITGGAGGIGGHVVQLLAERGITVVVLDIQPLSYRALSNVHWFKCDITSQTEIATVAAEIRGRIGEPTVLINNAGECCLRYDEGSKGGD